MYGKRKKDGKYRRRIQHFIQNQLQRHTTILFLMSKIDLNTLINITCVSNLREKKNKKEKQKRR